MAVGLGSVPVWIGTLIGGTTAMVAVFNYRRSVADKEREQASRVASWISVDTKNLARDTVGVDQYLLSVRAVLHVVNRSDAPIYDLHVRCRRPEDLSKAFDPKAPSPNWDELVAAELPASLEGRGDLPWEFHKDVDPEEMEIEKGKDPNVEVPDPVLTFTDALGRRWKRTGTRPVRRSRERRPSRPTAKIAVKRHLASWG
jgi:hypothetical protein